MDQTISLLLYKFLKFGITGIIGMFWDFGATYLCKEKLKIQKYISNAIGFILATSSNYFINNIWTFDYHSKFSTEQYFKFFMVSVIGLTFNSLILYFLHSKKELNFYLSKMIAIVLVFIWNFGMNYFFTFKH